MANLRTVTFVCLFLFVSIQRIDALQCYYCVSCTQPFSASSATIVTNNTAGLYCRKISALSVDSRDISDTCTSTNVFGNGQWCCQTDLCNHTNKLFSSIFLVFIFTAIIFIQK